jgi:hypothetical protein
MPAQGAFTVTLIKPSDGVPEIERGAYRYDGERLPRVGDTITVTRGEASDGDASPPILGYVTRVDPSAENPISVVEASPADTSDDLIVESDSR